VPADDAALVTLPELDAPAAREARKVREVREVREVPEATARSGGRGTSARHTATVGVLALQGDVAEHVRAINETGARALPVRRVAELAAVDGLIIPGGESTTIWKLAAIFDLAGPLRERIAAGLPVFGSCAGMIMLASRLVDRASDQQTFGAIDMTVRRNAFGRQLDSFESDIDIDGLAGPPFRAVFIRAPWVEEVGSEVEILATEPRTGRIVAVRQGLALATAFHPELTRDNRVHKIFTDIVKEAS
jgi:pyridoxal 5'-phosphate synthase pdxT subunit